jgi:uncharacterized membrane protein YphA (DoxX/SURF4 family)
MRNPWSVAVWATRIFLAALFLYAGLVKLDASESFALTMSKFSFLPESSVPWLALGLPAIEIFTAILLLIPRTARFAAGIVAVLLVTFIAALGWTLQQGFTADCGCFGEDGAPSRAKMIFAIVRDVALLALTLGLAGRRCRSRDSSH